MCGFEENYQKPDFRAKMAKFWTKKGPKMAPFFFVRTKIFIDYFLNNKLGLNIKIKKKSTKPPIRFIGLEENGQKTAHNHIMSPQAMYF